MINIDTNEYKKCPFDNTHSLPALRSSISLRHCKNLLILLDVRFVSIHSIHAKTLFTHPAFPCAKSPSLDKVVPSPLNKSITSSKAASNLLRDSLSAYGFSIA